jgi:hypothetical protein
MNVSPQLWIATEVPAAHAPVAVVVSFEMRT